MLRKRRRAYVTVGLGFGDEGKGSIVDALCHRTEADLVVRYSGGAQAHHRVVASDGREHIFSQVGAGTLAGVERTYLGPEMIVAPHALIPEVNHLDKLGCKFSIYAHPDCLVTTSYTIAANRLLERMRKLRGEPRHGSCGLGIGQTRQYAIEWKEDAIRLCDLVEPEQVRDKLARLQERIINWIHEDEYDIGALRNNFPLDVSLLDTPVKEEESVLRECMPLLKLHEELPDFNCAVFEGAQGILLDQTYGFHPHTTWSDVTTKPAIDLLCPLDVDLTTIGVTRAYSTRHGAGPFPTESNFPIYDKCNPENPWQGGLRSGPLDLVLLRYALSVCPVDYIAINCLDQVPRKIQVCDSYKGVAPEPRVLETQSLVYQQILGEWLRTVTPQYSSMSIHDIVRAVGMNLYTIQGTGPRTHDKIFPEPIK